MAGIDASVELGRLIRARREDAGIGQKPFARMMGWSPAVQSRLETGQRALMNDGEVYMVARGLGMEADQLRAAMGELLPFTSPQPTNADLMRELVALRGVVDRLAAVVLHGADRDGSR